MTDASASATYAARKGRLETYFDRTASETWARLTSDAPVSRIRATVRAGRDEMRALLLDWMGADLTGRRILDAGCGAGQLAIEAARRGAEVVAIDIAGSLVDVARERTPEELRGRIDYRTGDMLDPRLGRFDHVVAMDSLIHYRADDILRVVDALSGRCARSMVFTFCPRTPLLTAMWGVGKLMPRGDRSPAIEPVGAARLRRMIDRDVAHAAPARTRRVTSGFYISQALEVVAQ
jgi:magnesium-protoporphyrin O-methyltransferase